MVDVPTSKGSTLGILVLFNEWCAKLLHAGTRKAVLRRTRELFDEGLKVYLGGKSVSADVASLEDCYFEVHQ